MRVGSSRALGVVVALGPLLLGGCAGSLSHIHQQRLFDEAYAGFPPRFDDARLNALRSRYLAEKQVYDVDPDAFLGAELPALDCPLPEDAIRALAEGAFRPQIQDRNPRSIDFGAKNDLGRGEPILDALAFSLVEGDCQGGRLNGPARVYMSFAVIVPRDGDDDYLVYEMKVREDCTYRGTVRDGDCVRYSRAHRWYGRFTEDGRLLDTRLIRHMEDPEYWPEPDADDVHVVTTFDYGRHADGREAGPGVAFESAPNIGGDLSYLENYTLARLDAEDGRVRYAEYTGGTKWFSYYLRDGVAHGRLLVHQEIEGEDGHQCYVEGRRILTMQCPA